MVVPQGLRELSYVSAPSSPQPPAPNKFQSARNFVQCCKECTEFLDLEKLYFGPKPTNIMSGLSGIQIS